MLFHDEEQGHIIIGEAVINLAVSQKEINIHSLIIELGTMAEGDASDNRLAQIADARRWLKAFVETSPRNREELRWHSASRHLRAINNDR